MTCTRPTARLQGPRRTWKLWAKASAVASWCTISTRPRCLTRLIEASHGEVELSGGLQQRVGIARSLYTNPLFWLLGEPFSALDPPIRREMQDEILRLQATFSKAVVFVTHDFEEAARVGDRNAILRNGRMVECGPAEELVCSPADDYVSAFTAEVDRSSILKADRFIKRGPISDADAVLPAHMTLREVSRLFAQGTQVIGFHDDRQRHMGFMRREALGNALAAADQAGLH